MDYKDNVIRAKELQKKLEDLETRYSKYRSQKTLALILELRDKYQSLLSVIHS